MVDILLKDNFVIEISDSLLLAIEKNYVPIVIKFLKWKKLMREPKLVTLLIFTLNLLINLLNWVIILTSLKESHNYLTISQH